MKVSVVIPIKNGETSISQQLKALAQQETDLDWEVIVADNDSSDASREKVTGLQPSFPVPLRLIDASHLPGAAYARNEGARASSGDLICFCDSDDYVAPTWVQAAWEAYQDGAQVIGGEIRVSNYIQQGPINQPYRIFEKSGVLTTAFGQGVISCNLAVSKAAFAKIGGFDANLPTYGVEDVEFSMRASLAKLTFRSQPGFTIYFKETAAPSTLLKKVYITGIGRTVVWHHYSQYFGNVWSIKSTLNELASWLIHTPAEFKNLGPKKYLRSLVERVGAVHGSIYYRFKGWPEPEYF